MPPRNSDELHADAKAAPRPTRFLDCIDSVVFMPEGQGPDQRWSVAAADLSDWLVAYQEWFMKETGIAEGRNLHRLYNREVVLSGNGLAENMPEFDSLAETLRENRMGLTWCMSLAEVVFHYRELLQRVEGSMLSSLSIWSAADDAKLSRRDCSPALDALANAKCQLQFIGNLKVLEQHGVLDLPAINRANITHRPRNFPLTGSIMRSEQTRPCRSQFRLFVASDGLIYPCFPLIGLTRCAVGTIRQPIAEVMTGKASILDLDQLAQHGPSLPEILGGACQAGIPLACDAHRASILRESA